MDKKRNLKNIIFEKAIKNSGYLLVFLALILALSLIGNIKKTLKVKEKISQERKNLEELLEQKEELTQKLSETQSEVFLETQMRDKLGLSKEGEVIVVLPDEEVLKNIVPVFNTEPEVLPYPTWKKWLKLFI